MMLVGCEKKPSRVEQGNIDQVLHRGNGQEPEQVDVLLGTGHTLLAGRNALRDDADVQKHVIQRDSPSTKRKGQCIPDALRIGWEQSDAQNHNEPEHENSLIPAQGAWRKLHYLAEK